MTAGDAPNATNPTNPAAERLLMASWRPGSVYKVDSGPIYVASAPKGLDQVGVRVLAGAPGDPLAPPLAITLEPGASGGAITDGGTRLVVARVTVR